MRLLFALCFVSVLAACSSTQNVTSSSEAFNFWLGTYTDGESEGIYRWQLDAKGNLSQLGLSVKTVNPSYLALSADEKTMLCVNETDVNGSGGVQSFRVKDNLLELIDTRPSGGAHPCHISVNPEGAVVVSNYTGGNVGLLNVDAKGRLTDLLNTQNHPGDADEKPHAHATYFVDNSSSTISVDLGTNDLWLSTVTSNSLQPSVPEKLALEDGAGPRHMAFHPSGKWLFVINEYANTVTTIARLEGGAFAKRASYSTLPSTFKGESFCADIHVSKDGRFLYGSNRGANTIVAFSINESTGALTQIDQESVRGDWPRNFSLSPDERFIVVANQRSNNLVVLQRDAKTGALDYKSETKAPAPVCVLF